MMISNRVDERLIEISHIMDDIHHKLSKKCNDNAFEDYQKLSFNIKNFVLDTKLTKTERYYFYRKLTSLIRGRVGILNSALSLGLKKTG